MPVGYVVSMLLLAVCVAFALASPHPRSSRPFRWSFWFANIVNELPFLTFFVIVADTLLAASQGDLSTAGGVVGLGLAVLTTVGLGFVVRRAVPTHRYLTAALVATFGADSANHRPDRPRPSRWLRIVLWPFPWWFRRDVARTANLVYGPDRRHRLDVFRPARLAPNGSILIQLHGGGFRIGKKNLECRPLINRLTSRGWVCISANYRMGRSVTFPEHLIDAKRVIAWVKEHAAELGGDRSHVYLVGSSAGGHIASVAGLTMNDHRFQPGFEQADTTVAGVISFYGYYGSIASEGLPSSPHDYVGADAPPFAIVHGDQDTLVIIEDARAFAAALRASSRAPVLYAELPGAHHNFDFFHSIRFEAVVDALETFLSSIPA